MKKAIKLTTMGVFLAIALFSGWQMTQLELWGYRPLFFFGGAWGFFLLLIEGRFSGVRDHRSLLVWSVLAGFMLSAGFPPMPGFFFMFLGFVPLLYVERLIAEERGMARWEVFKFGFVTFLTWNILTTYWVTNTLFLAGLLALIPNSLLMSIPWVLFHYTKTRMGDRLGYPAFVGYWIVFEYIHLNWEDLSWPWLTLGNSFAGFPEIVQWYEITGVFGGTLWILVLNVLIFKVLYQWIKYGKDEFSRKGIILPALIFLLPIIVSLIIYANWEPKGEKAEVVVVQPNYEPHYEKFSVPESVQLRRFLRLAKEQVTENTDYLVFPETSFDNIRHNTMESHPVLVALRNFVDGYPKLKLITGLSSYRIFKTDESPGPTAPRVYVQGGDTTIYEGYNSAIQITSGDPEIPVYLKSRLVPGPELPPLASVTKFLKPFVNSLGGTMEGLGTQKERSVFKSQDGSMAVAPVICYESIFGEYVTRYVHNGATAIFVITNDGWWDNTAGHKQHLRFASLRAIETRRSVARSANTGISCFINQRGNIFAATNYGEDAVINGTIQMNTETTFYTKYGDLIARLACFFSALMLLMSFTRRWVGTEQKL